ncbi:MAG TPA: hypothetical protein VK787_07990 [Puia sp.]|jgi:hypothetical protein|nr:hypothetical protein [Puia sp.]
MKERAKNYDTKLAVNGTFEDVIKVSVTPMPAQKKTKRKNKGLVFDVSQICY